MNINGVKSSNSVYQSLTSVKEKTTKSEQETESSADVVVELGEKKETKTTYDKPKGLSSDQVKALKESQENEQLTFLRNLANQSINKQAESFAGATQLNFDGVLVDTSEFALPEGGSTPEEAAAAIADGGEYSIDAVATRIFSMAEKISNGDSDKLETMRNAVTKGFKQAGLDFKSITKSDLPQICQDTYKEVMKRFDQLAEKLAGGATQEVSAEA